MSGIECTNHRMWGVAERKLERGIYEEKANADSALVLWVITTRLRSLASESSSELEVLGLDSDSLGVNGGQVG